MSTFVLVHGSWHGAWCWYKIVPALQAAGHNVVALDLPGLGNDKTPVAEVTLDSWLACVCAALDEAAEPVVLVGHSRGGLVISGAAERRPDKIAKLVYLAAFLMPSGQTMLEAAGTDPDSLAATHLDPHPEEGYILVKDEGVVPAFYADCTAQDIALARLCLQPEPLVPLGTPLQTSPENFGRVPRAYIECTGDRAISIAAQRRMHGALSCDPVLTMHTDHSPFFSAPEELTQHLLSLV
ncbi:MAG: alpha/beta fold hydrolase [Pseudomonadota bacterium]